ncbi:MAG TPA: RHS repeat-associated core domain-containing protein, partial [Chitinophagaceae bacterium]|nr:RHS repeat-associated core domain-containing protein [Chitinophagaceae bacterium]
INVNVFAVMPTGGLPSSLTGASLYNGNISSMLVNIPALSSNTPYLYGYRYDQLNRIKMMDAFTVTENYNNNYDQSLDIALAQTSDYKERISYDPNGKIVTYGRWGKARQLDSATYNYTTNSNKLNYISDPIGKITDDVGNQSANNYQWDEIGEMTHDADRGLSNATWTVYGKIQSQSLSNGTTINYTYDAGGNRISKTVSGTNGYTEYYVRDASGNTMSVYRAGDNSINSGNLTQTEINLYGSSRLGTYKPNTDVTTVPGNTVTLTDGSIAYLYNFTRGNKFFELTDHRCNNLATISDKKTPIDQNTDGFIDYYLADVVTAQDYSSFGALLDGRQTGNTPRYTYNGKQLDKELGWQEYGMREYLGGSVPVFASVDPLTKAYPWYTPYQFAGNRPIIAIDLDGMEPLDVNTHQPKAELSPTAAENKPASDPTAHGNNIIPWKDLLNFKVPLKLIEGTKGRDVGAIVQDINNATGANTNFDYYTVQINKLPLGIDNGGELFEKIRKNIGYFMDENTEFGGYSNNDRKKWESSNPLGSVMSFDAKFTPLKLNFDDASVITSSYYKNNEGGFWTFSTITSNGDGYHPISGTRQFGVSTIQGNNGISYLFYIRATDRARGGMEAMLQKTVFESAEATWKTVCASVAGYVNEYGGTAQNPSEPISKRIPWNEVKELNKKK